MSNNPHLPTPHTPGPWWSANSGGQVRCSTKVIYALETVPLKITPEIAANALLGSLAPELLEALVNLLDAYTIALVNDAIGDARDLFHERIRARAVLEKYYGPVMVDAEGRLIPRDKLYPQE